MRTLEPLMNIVGQPVARALRVTAQSPSSLIVLQDSLNHEPCSLKLKFGGSPSGHRGVCSIIHSLQGNREFYRLMLGIGRGSVAREYVLGPLSSHEKEFWGINGEGVELVWEHLEKIAKDVAKRSADNVK